MPEGAATPLVHLCGRQEGPGAHLSVVRQATLMNAIMKKNRNRVWKEGRCGVCLRDKVKCRKCKLPFCPLDKKLHREECR